MRKSLSISIFCSLSDQFHHLDSCGHKDERRTHRAITIIGIRRCTSWSVSFLRSFNKCYFSLCETLFEYWIDILKKTGFMLFDLLCVILKLISQQIFFSLNISQLFSELDELYCESVDGILRVLFEYLISGLIRHASYFQSILFVCHQHILHFKFETLPVDFQECLSVF